MLLLMLQDFFSVYVGCNKQINGLRNEQNHSFGFFFHRKFLHNISPRRRFDGNVFGENKLHIRNQHNQLSPSPLRFRESTSDHKQKKNSKGNQW